MGVMMCDRDGCETTCCDRTINYSNQSADYICDSCYEELQTFKNTWPIGITKAEVMEKIREFMRSTPGTMNQETLDSREAIDDELDRLVSDHNYDRRRKQREDDY